LKKKLIWMALGVVALVVIVVAVVAATFKMPEFVGMDGIEIQEIKPEDPDGSGLKAVVKGRIYNANFFSLSARNLEYLVTYQDTVLGRGKFEGKLTVGAGDTTELALPLRLGLEAIAAVHKTLLGHEKSVLDIHLEGEFTSLGYARGLDFQTEIDPAEFMRQIIGRIMEYDSPKMEEVTLKEASLKSSQFSFVSMVFNPLEVPLELKTLEMTFYPQGDAVNAAGNWKMEKAIPLAPHYSTRVPGTVVIQHLQAGKGVVTTILTGEIRYDAKGKLKLGLADHEFEVPVEGVVVLDPVTRKGRWE
jgi:LEA14-like dessication related protein